MLLFTLKNSILRLPYILAYAKLKLFAKCIWQIDVWPRHSFIESYFRAGTSDLDLSIYSPAPGREVVQFLKYYSFCKKFLPFLGEVYVYDDFRVELIKKLDVNGFELLRDPLFIKKFNFLNAQLNFSKPNAFVFLARTLQNDLHKLQTSPRLRVEKWKFHLSKVRELISEKEGKIPLVLNENAVLYSIVGSMVNLISSSNKNELKLLRTRMRMLAELCHRIKDDHFFSEWVKPVLEDSIENQLMNSVFVQYLLPLKNSSFSLDDRFSAILQSHINWILLNEIRSCRPNGKFHAALSSLENLEHICIHHVSGEYKKYSPLILDTIGYLSRNQFRHTSNYFDL